MGITAEYLARLHGVQRQQMDEFSARSHQLAAQARDRGAFQREIIPVPGHTPDGFPILVAEDETIRDNVTVESLAELKPVFDPVNGQITAGSSSQLSDGASAMLVMSAARALSLGLPMLATVVSTAVAGAHPSVRGCRALAGRTRAPQGAELP